MGSRQQRVPHGEVALTNSGHAPHAACLGLVYAGVYHVDRLPEWARVRLQQWLGKSEHERAAPTSKLIAYHLEIWFSDNRRASAAPRACMHRCSREPTPAAGIGRSSHPYRWCAEAHGGEGQSSRLPPQACNAKTCGLLPNGGVSDAVG